MFELVGVLLVIGAFAFGVLRFIRYMAARTFAACTEAARVLPLPAVAMSPDEAAMTFLLPGREVHGDVTAFRGTLRDVDVVLAAFTHDSNTAFNGAVIPITATHVVARLRTPLSSEPLLVSRRVVLDPPGDVALGEPLEAAAVARGADHEALRLLATQPLAGRIIEFLEAGGGNAFIHADRCATLVAHQDPSMIRAAVRSAVDLARAIDQAFVERRSAGP